MNFPLQRSRRKVPVIVILFAIIALLLVFRPSFPQWISSPLNALGIPLWSVQEVVGEQGSQILNAPRSKQSIIEQNRKLQEEIELLRLDLLNVSLLREENRALKEIVGRYDEEEVIVAGIIARPNRTPYDTMIVDAGSKQGVKKGDIVLIGGVPIGHISATRGSTSQVILFSSPGTETEVLVGPENIASTAVGKGGGNFIIELPRDLVVVEGYSVFISGISTSLIAQVGSVERNPTDSFQKIRFRSPVNISEVRFVEIVPQLVFSAE